MNQAGGSDTLPATDGALAIRFEDLALTEDFVAQDRLLLAPRGLGSTRTMERNASQGEDVDLSILLHKVGFLVRLDQAHRASGGGVPKTAFFDRRDVTFEFFHIDDEVPMELIAELNRAVGEYFTGAQLSQLVSMLLDEYLYHLSDWASGYLVQDILAVPFDFRYPWEIRGGVTTDWKTESVPLGEICKDLGLNDMCQRMGRPKSYQGMVEGLSTGSIAALVDEKLYDRTKLILAQELRKRSLPDFLRLLKGEGDAQIVSILNTALRAIAGELATAAEGTDYSISLSGEQKAQFSLSREAVLSMEEHCMIPQPLLDWPDQLACFGDQTTFPVVDYGDNEVDGLNALELVEAKLLRLFVEKGWRYRFNAEREGRARGMVRHGVDFFSEQVGGILFGMDSQNNTRISHLAALGLVGLWENPGLVAHNLKHFSQFGRNPHLSQLLGLEGGEDVEAVADRYVEQLKAQVDRLTGGALSESVQRKLGRRQLLNKKFVQ